MLDDQFLSTQDHFAAFCSHIGFDFLLSANFLTALLILIIYKQHRLKHRSPLVFSLYCKTLTIYSLSHS